MQYNEIFKEIIRDYDFGIYEVWDSKSDSEIKERICFVYISKLEEYCNWRFAYFLPKFSKLPLNEDNFRTYIYGSMQHLIRNEIENHFKLFKEKYPDKSSEIIITSDEIVWQNCKEFCYWILESEINDFLFKSLDWINEETEYRRNLFKPIIDFINYKLPSKVINRKNLVLLINEFYDGTNSYNREIKEKIKKIYPINTEDNMIEFILKNINYKIDFSYLRKEWWNRKNIKNHPSQKFDIQIENLKSHLKELFQ